MLEVYMDDMIVQTNFDVDQYCWFSGSIHRTSKAQHEVKSHKGRVWGPSREVPPFLYDRAKEWSQPKKMQGDYRDATAKDQSLIIIPMGKAPENHVRTQWRLYHR